MPQCSSGALLPVSDGEHRAGMLAPPHCCSFICLLFFSFNMRSRQHNIVNRSPHSLSSLSSLLHRSHNRAIRCGKEAWHDSKTEKQKKASKNKKAEKDRRSRRRRCTQETRHPNTASLLSASTTRKTSEFDERRMREQIDAATKRSKERDDRVAKHKHRHTQRKEYQIRKGREIQRLPRLSLVRLLRRWTHQQKARLLPGCTEEERPRQQHCSVRHVQQRLRCLTCGDADA